MKAITILITLMLTGCAGWTPVQEIQGSNGKTYYWIAPLPATTNGEQGIGARSAGVTTYTGSVNGKGYSVSSFR